MKNTTAFLGGCAVTGVLALLFFKGCFNFGFGSLAGLGANLGSPPEGEESLSLLPVPTPPGSPNNFDQWNSQLVLQQASTDELKKSLEQQRQLIEQLRSSLEQQKIQSERLTMQLQEQQRAIESLRLDQRNPRLDRYEQAAMFQTNLLWAIAGVVLVLVVGGSIMVVGAIAMLMQPTRRSPYRSQAFDPSHFSPPYSFYQPYTDFLPPQSKNRRSK
jgi:hypothetical protein